METNYHRLERYLVLYFFKSLVIMVPEKLWDDLLSAIPPRLWSVARLEERKMIGEGKWCGINIATSKYLENHVIAIGLDGDITVIGLEDFRENKTS